MTEENWRDPSARCIGLRLAGDAIEEVDVRGEQITDHTFLVLLNAHYAPQMFVLPSHRSGVRWEIVLDTRAPDSPRRLRLFPGGQPYELDGRCLALFCLKEKS
jgi:glycogen operon protein